MIVTVFIDGEEVLDALTVQKCTGISNSKLYEFLRYNLFPQPFAKVKNKSYWKKADIEEYIEKNRK
jgi:predicted DNA-binding transcriptional regulator AlpA